MSVVSVTRTKSKAMPQMKRGNQRTLYSVEYIWRREMIERDLSRITIPAVLDGTSTDHYHSASVSPSANCQPQGGR